MNTAYQYKTGRNNIDFANNTSKKGTCRPFVRKRPAYVDFAEKFLSFIDNYRSLFNAFAKFFLVLFDILFFRFLSSKFKSKVEWSNF